MSLYTLSVGVETITYHYNATLLDVLPLFHIPVNTCIDIIIFI